ncbi:MAG TPA: DNA mismatch repair protein MutS, partial [Paenibacillaceae bacterium]|nr:DNA mismatch repair protein MutS [Paenibacillaceae bacterium]
YISRLIEKGYRVAICEQVEDPKQAKGVVRREVTRVMTPGTILDGSLLTDKENNYLLAFYERHNRAALAACDISTGEFYATEMPGEGSRLLDEILQYNPSELIWIRGDETETTHWVEKFALYGIFVSERPVSEPLGEPEQLLQSWFASITNDKQCTPEMVCAIKGLLNYLEETQKRSMVHLNRIHLYEGQKYMMLDQFTRRNLELTETIRDKGKKGSLLWLLDRTVTAMGGRLLRRWVDKPLLSRQEIEKRQEAVQTLVDHWLGRDDLCRWLDEVYDLERLGSRISFGTANARDLVQLKLSLQAIPHLKESLLALEGRSKSLHQLALEMDECRDVAEIIDKGIVDDPPLAIKEGGLIKEGYNGYLDQLKKAGTEGKQWIANLEKREREATGIRSLKVGYNKIFGYYIEVTKANLSTLPEGRYERKQTLSNAERFVTPELKEKESLILEAKEKRTELEYELFVEIRDQVAREVQRIQKLAERVAAVDVLQSFADLAQEKQYVCPVIVDDGPIAIVEGRHPVVEAVLVGEPFVPNNTGLEPEKQQIILITGPNMAGKSTYMRQVALMVLMAQIGSFIPAQEAKITPVDRIFTRIGAADDLTGGQSTFMVEMKEIEVTLKNATPGSLVIIDELGRGTSTAEGMSIAQAVIEYLHDEIGCKTLVSTHYHELSHLEENLTRLKNYHMAVNEVKDTVIFLRKLIEGPADKSYGIYCAEIAGLPNKIIVRAHQLLSELTQNQGVGQASLPLVVQETASTQADQLDLFGELEEKPLKASKGHGKEDKILKKLKEADLINMTPLEAMNFLFALKKQI